MKTLSYAAILLFAFAVPVHAAQVYSGCAQPPSTFRHVWYFDPVHGKTSAAGGNGSQAAPWDNLQALVQGEPGYSFPLLTTAPYRQVPVAGQPAVVEPGPKAGPVAPGDDILLMSGNYGNIWLSTNGLEISNSDFVTIQAAPGQTPVLTSLFVGPTNDWVFNGLKVQSLQAAAVSGNTLVEVKDGGAALPTSDIVFENMSISSQDDAEAWSKAQWLANARTGFWAQGTAGGANTKCISLTGSHITNVKTGAGLLASQLLFSNNQIDHFGDDGLDFGASNLAITHNNLHDNLGIDDNHEDAMQGVIGVLAPGVAENHYQNVLIDSNLIIRQTDPELSFPTYLQGIDAFDGDWTNMTVTNNVIVTSSCYTIGLASLHNSLIANNTALVDGLVSSPGCTAAINIGGATHEGSGSSNVRIANNLAEHFFINDQNEPTVTFDHNVALNSYQPFVHWNGTAWTYSYPAGTDANGNKAFATAVSYASQFLAWNPAALSFNLMLKAGSVAIGAGTATGAPTVDILGATRTAPYTAGAYSYPD
jgi:hypothetical protein